MNASGVIYNCLAGIDDVIQFGTDLCRFHHMTTGKIIKIDAVAVRGSLRDANCGQHQSMDRYLANRQHLSAGLVLSVSGEVTTKKRVEH